MHKKNNSHFLSNRAQKSSPQSTCEFWAEAARNQRRPSASLRRPPSAECTAKPPQWPPRPAANSRPWLPTGADWAAAAIRGPPKRRRWPATATTAGRSFQAKFDPKSPPKTTRTQKLPDRPRIETAVGSRLIIRSAESKGRAARTRSRSDRKPGAGGDRGEGGKEGLAMKDMGKRTGLGIGNSMRQEVCFGIGFRRIGENPFGRVSHGGRL